MLAQQQLRVYWSYMQGEILAAQLDLTDLAAVAAFAQQLQQELCIDTLILNAGVMGVPLGYTQHGFETHIATNHFGHFYLFQLLESKLAAQVSFLASSAVA